MRGGASGWRTARWRGGAMPLATEVALPAGVQPMPATSAGVLPGRLARLEDRFSWPWQGVDWSLAYVSFLVYVFVISSYIVNIGQPMMLLALLGITFGKRERWRLSAPILLLAVFLLLIAVTFQGTEYRSYDWVPLTDMAKVAAIFAVASSVLNSRARLRFFMFYYLAVFALYPVRGGIFNWFIYNATTQGRVGWNHLFENPNDFAALMIFPLGLVIAVWLSERNKLIRLLAFAGVSALPLVIFLTQSRGAILALAGGVFAYFLFQGKGRIKTLLTVVAVAGVLAVFAPKDVWTRMRNLQSATSSGELTTADDYGSAAQRFEIWKVAWKVHEAFPFTGVGWGGYPNAHAEFARRPGIAVIARGARDSHNTYLTLLAETGYVGFATWAAMLAVIVGNAVRAMRRVGRYVPEYALQIRVILLALLSFGVAGMFGSFAHMSFLYLHLAALIGLAAVSNAEVDVRERVPALRRGGAISPR